MWSSFFFKNILLNRLYIRIPITTSQTHNLEKEIFKDFSYFFFQLNDIHKKKTS